MTYYDHAAATCTALNEELINTKIYFTKVYNVFAFPKLLTCRSHLSDD